MLEQAFRCPMHWLGELGDLGLCGVVFSAGHIFWSCAWLDFETRRFTLGLVNVEMLACFPEKVP